MDPSKNTKVDEPLGQSRRRRIEMPLMDPKISGIISIIGPPPSPTPSPSVTKSAKNLIAEHVERCQPANYRYDVSIFDDYPFDTPEKIADVLKVLYYRARQQSAILNVFMELNQRGYVGTSGLRKPKIIGGTTASCSKVSGMVKCFEFFVKEENAHPNEVCPYWNSATTSQYVAWLACMIVRDSCCEPAKLLEAIGQSKFFGKLDQKALNRWKSRNPRADIIADGCDSVGKHHPPFGWWLPQDIGDGCSEDELQQKVYDSVLVFNKIEKVFRDYFNVRA